MPLADEYEIICIDEAHFKRDADKRKCWSLIGQTPIVYVNGSHQKTNVYGAYTLSGKFHYKFVERQISEKTITFFERLRKIYGKIVFILDQACWHTSKKVEKYIQQHKEEIKVFFFPTATPELNAVEECWKQTRTNVTGNIAFDSVQDLKKALRSSWNKQPFQHKVINYLSS